MEAVSVAVVFAGPLLGLGVPELIIILVIALLIFGPKNLPKLGSAIGKTVKGVRDGLEGNDELPEASVDDDDEDEEEEDEEEEEKPVKKVAAKKKK
ncbi:MAG: twin-arginine translocase TatA/TatE family subunit [Coriobacteriales bacterium]|jgi:sec-independent protein translocase protein TatA|nr:twin-arginine translocase TatA/TatE family subunit [Coriobacteriales bacterium]